MRCTRFTIAVAAVGAGIIGLAPVAQADEDSRDPGGDTPAITLDPQVELALPRLPIRLGGPNVRLAPQIGLGSIGAPFLGISPEPFMGIVPCVKVGVPGGPNMGIQPCVKVGPVAAEPSISVNGGAEDGAGAAG